MGSVRKFLTILVFFFIFGCSNTKPNNELINGYRLIKSNDYRIDIIKSGRVVVDAYISDVEVISVYILGYRKRPLKYIAPDGFISEEYGFFILNSKDGQLQESVSKAEIIKLKRDLLDMGYEVSYSKIESDGVFKELE